jgi:EAL domain-containing protein (putative c-di-GMP-specific phosphodiesterase class I)
VNLLALDDDPVMGGVVVEIARRAGYDARLVTTAADFAVALAGPVDIVTLDLLVPGTDGVELLRSLADAGHAPDIILVSGMDERVIAGARRVADQLGLTVLGQIHKPFRAAELRVLLDQSMSVQGRADRARLLQSPPGIAHGANGAHGAHGARVARVTRDELMRAVIRDELTLAYQPQVSLETGRWIGAEALVRWQHPELGLLMPSDFLALVDDELLAADLTGTVVRRAAREWIGIQRLSREKLTLSINLHPLALADPGLAALIVDAVGTAQLEPRHVVLEVTEVAPATGPAALSTLTRLRMRGFQLSIDDFGTGHSSLDRLNQVPFTELKIDRSFVGEVRDNPWARTIAAQSITLARALGLRCVAEGVDHPGIVDWLRDAGCDLAQGYHLARPVWPAELGSLVASRSPG